MATATIKSQWNGRDVKIRGRKVVDKTAFEIGLVVEGQAKLFAPRDTGRLAGSITTQSAEQGTAPQAPALSGDVIKKPSDNRETFVGTAVDYAPYQEFLSKPFLRPAFDLAKGEMLTIGERNGRLEFTEYLK